MLLSLTPTICRLAYFHLWETRKVMAVKKLVKKHTRNSLLEDY